MNVGSLISGSSSFSKPRLHNSKLSVHVLLKPGLKDFEHYLASVWNECNCLVVRTFFDITLLWDWNESWLFPVLWPLLRFPKLWHIECSTLTPSSLRILNSSAGILSPPLALFLVMLPKVHLTSHSRMSGTLIIPSWLSRSLDISVYSCYLFLIFSASVRSYHFCSLLCPSLHEMFPQYLQFSWRAL